MNALNEAVVDAAGRGFPGRRRRRGGPGHRHCGQRQGLRRGRGHPLLHSQHRVEAARPHDGVHQGRPGPVVGFRAVPEACGRPTVRAGPGRRGRAGPGLPSHRGHSARDPRVSRDRHRHLPRPRGTQRTPRRVGVGLAKWLVLSGTDDLGGGRVGDRAGRPGGGPGVARRGGHRGRGPRPRDDPPPLHRAGRVSIARAVLRSRTTWSPSGSAAQTPVAMPG